MTDHAHVLTDLAGRLDAAGIGYMVIGGTAAIVWGVGRTTIDVDIIVALRKRYLPRLLAALGDTVEVLTPDPMAFANKTGVVPARHRSGMRVDLILGSIAYAKRAIARAKAVDIGGATVNVCTPEDLLLLKIVSTRERDRADVQSLIRLRRDSLDRRYLDPRVHELALLLEDPSIEQRYRFLFTSD